MILSNNDRAQRFRELTANLMIKTWRRLELRNMRDSYDLIISRRSRIYWELMDGKRTSCEHSVFELRQYVNSLLPPLQTANK